MNSLFTFILMSAFSVCMSLCDVPSEATVLIPIREVHAPSGSAFVRETLTVDAQTREKRIREEILRGNFPGFMRELVEITVEITSATGEPVKGSYYVMPDYLMIGSDDDFVRMPMQPATAQEIADAFGFFLSTKKICDDVYRTASVKLEPYPLTVDRESMATFALHHELIEQQRKGAAGLIAGIKKDVIITPAIHRDSRPNRLALYGWHKPDGKPIQPVYTGHVEWYVDYSHGFRLVSRTIYINGKPMDYIEVLKDPFLSRLICDEEGCDFYAYPYPSSQRVYY